MSQIHIREQSASRNPNGSTVITLPDGRVFSLPIGSTVREQAGGVEAAKTRAAATEGERARPWEKYAQARTGDNLSSVC
jgi:hypothetical protein